MPTSAEHNRQPAEAVGAFPYRQTPLSPQPRSHAEPRPHTPPTHTGSPRPAGPSPPIARLRASAPPPRRAKTSLFLLPFLQLLYQTALPGDPRLPGTDLQRFTTAKQPRPPCRPLSVRKFAGFNTTNRPPDPTRTPGPSPTGEAAPLPGTPPFTLTLLRRPRLSSAERGNSRAEPGRAGGSRPPRTEPARPERLNGSNRPHPRLPAALAGCRPPRVSVSVGRPPVAGREAGPGCGRRLQGGKT